MIILGVGECVFGFNGCVWDIIECLVGCVVNN